MSLKPIDMQVIIPKTAEVSKIHSDENQRNLVLQQQQAISMQNKVENDIRQVYMQQKAYEAKIREKQEKSRGNGRENSKGGKGGSGKKSSNETRRPEIRTSTIDIKI